MEDLNYAVERIVCVGGTALIVAGASYLAIRQACSYLSRINKNEFPSG